MQIGTTPVCVTMNAVRTGMVAKSKPVAVRVYDYYEPGQCFFSSSGCVSCRLCQGRESWEIPCCYDGREWLKSQMVLMLMGGG